MRNLIFITALLLTSCQGFFNISNQGEKIDIEIELIQDCQVIADSTTRNDFRFYTVVCGNQTNASWLRFKTDTERNLFDCHMDNETNFTGKPISQEEAEQVNVILTVRQDRVYYEFNGTSEDAQELVFEIDIYF